MIRIDGISKYWDKTPGPPGGISRIYGLRDASLEIKRGEFTVIMGAPGSGKSTLLRVIGLLELPSEGRLALDGRDVSNLPDRERAKTRNRFFGFLFEGSYLLPELSAIENVQVPMAYAGISARQRHERACELLDKVGLSRHMHYRPDAMSAVDQQRVAIARALANDPGFLFADEPTGALSGEAGWPILDLIGDLNGEGMTVVMATHDSNLGKLGSRRVSISAGKIADGGMAG